MNYASIKIMDVSKSDFLYQDGLWYITLSFNKSVIYTDRNGVVSEKTIFEIIFEEILNQYKHSVETEDYSWLEIEN